LALSAKFYDLEEIQLLSFKQSILQIKMANLATLYQTDRQTDRRTNQQADNICIDDLTGPENQWHLMNKQLVKGLQ